MKIFRPNKKSYLIICIILLLVLVIFIFGILKVNFDKSDFIKLSQNILNQASTLDSNEKLREYIEQELKDRNIKYTNDSQGNIIMNNTKESSATKTLIACDYNYLSLYKNYNLISSAITIASTDVSKKVILFNNTANSYCGYHNMKPSLLADIDRIIYLNYGNQKYISKSSFAFTENDFVIPINKTNDRFDTDIRISIGGFSTSEIDSTAYKYPNLLNLMSQVLNRLKNKSIDFGLSDFSCSGQGNMFPNSITFTLHVNAYSSESIKNYIDKRIAAFNKNYLKEFDTAYYKYEIKPSNSLTTEIYDSDTTDKIYDFIYTVKNSTSRYEKENETLNGADEGDICGIRTVNRIYEKDNTLIAHVYLQAASDKLLKQYINENKQISQIIGINLEELTIFNAFKPHPNNKLLRDINFAYFRSNDLTSKNIIIKEKTADYATPCSILQSKSGLDSIIILRMNEDSKYNITNALINL